MILHHCDLPSLIALYYDSHWHTLIVAEFALSYNELLSSFVPDPLALRSIMRKTCAIITGSTALHFLLRQPNTWRPHDVDFIVPRDEFSPFMGFMLQLPGATIVRDMDHDQIDLYGLTGAGFR